MLLQSTPNASAVRRGLVRGLSALAWGHNDAGMCGTGSKESMVLHPCGVAGLQDCQDLALSAGRASSGALHSSGTCQLWGSGSAGQLGTASAASRSIPASLEQPSGLSQVRQLALGGQHTLLLDAHGAVWAMGENKEGQCGIGTSLEDIALQRRQDWTQGTMAAQVWH